ncbi:hypothetical protein [Lewinella sp. W8]|uniref:hypothetical protein n=1 Tax=Lewinella sp. W8 TaxID=2528208 RepID=UPI001068625D|nr:hypothetical protein [Lewinella sp. W8]MTB53376.1 hypothetical protein [Lewinella sp. W8]
MTDQAESLPARKPAWALMLSGLFHPLLVPTYMFLLLVAVNPYLFGSNNFLDTRSAITLLMIFLYTFVIPLVSVVLMLALGMISSLMIDDRMERIGPLLLVMVLYFWVYYNFSQSNDIPTIFSSYMLGIVMALGASFVINVADKISLHAVGMGGLVGMAMITMAIFGANGIQISGLTFSLGLLVLLTVILAGLVGSARLALKAHAPGQLYVGYAVGFIAQLAALLYYFQG